MRTKVSSWLTPIWRRTQTRRDGDPKHITPTEADQHRPDRSPTTKACSNAPARRPEASMMTCSARIPSTIGNGSAILFRHWARSVQQRLLNDARPRRAWILCKTAQNAVRTGPTPVLSFTERRTDDDERSAQRNRALNRIQATTIRNVWPCGERDMATTATLPDREAEELETRSGPPTKWSLAICKLACRTVDFFLNKL